MAVKRIIIRQLLQTEDRGTVRAFHEVLPADPELALADHFLNLAQALLRLLSELAVGELDEQLLELVLSAEGVGTVAVRLLHLLVVDHRHLQLGLDCLLHVREEGDEVMVLGLRLGQP